MAANATMFNIRHDDVGLIPYRFIFYSGRWIFLNVGDQEIDFTIDTGSVIANVIYPPPALVKINVNLPVPGEEADDDDFVAYMKLINKLDELRLSDIDR